MAKKKIRETNQLNKPRSKKRSHKGTRLGRFSVDEENYIFQNYTFKTVRELAEELNRGERGVREFLEKHKLKTDNTDEELKRRLYGAPYWGECRESLMEHEVPRFVQKWAGLMRQFNLDVTYTEQLQIKRFIMLEILRDRTIKAQTDCLRQAEDLRIEVEQEKLKNRPDRAKISELTRLAAELTTQADKYTKSHTDLGKESSNLLKELRGRREDRIQRINDASRSWAGALNALEDDETREYVGKEIQLIQLAKQRAKVKLMERMKFIDQKVDSPLLNHETLEFLEEQEKKDEENSTK